MVSPARITAKAQEEKVADRMASDARPPLNRFAKLVKVPDLAPGSVMDPAIVMAHAMKEHERRRLSPSAGLNIRKIC